MNGNKEKKRILYLVRHGRVAFEGGIKRCIGHTDVPLSDEGRDDARALGVYFREHPVIRIYSSPLSRCMETASILSGGKTPVETVPGLTELYMGEWENLPLKSIKKDLETEPLTGEGREAGLRRFCSTIDGLLSLTQGDIICVSHAGINCCYLSSLLKTPLETSRSITQPYGCINIIEITSSGRHPAVIGLKPGPGI